MRNGGAGPSQRFRMHVRRRRRRVRQQQQLVVIERPVTSAARRPRRRRHRPTRRSSKLVPAAIKSKGTLTVAADASYAPNEFIGSDGHTVVGMDRRSDEGARRRDGAEGQRRQRDVRQHHPGPGRRQVRHRRLVVHRHQGAREGRSTSSTTSSPASRSSRRPPGGTTISGLADLCGQDGRGREGHDRGDRRQGPERQVQGGRQARRERARVPGPERRQPGALERPRAGRYGRLAGRRLPGQAVKRHSSSSSARPMRPRRTASRCRRTAGSRKPCSRRSRC